MFDSLSSRIQDAFQSLRGEVRLTEDHVETALREIRLALLEADVNFIVVRAFFNPLELWRPLGLAPETGPSVAKE